MDIIIGVFKANHFIMSSQQQLPRGFVSEYLDLRSSLIYCLFLSFAFVFWFKMMESDDNIVLKDQAICQPCSSAAVNAWDERNHSEGMELRITVYFVCLKYVEPFMGPFFTPLCVFWSPNTLYSVFGKLISLNLCMRKWRIFPLMFDH